MAEAERYAEEHCYAEWDEQGEDLLAYIQDILKSEDFQRDPQGYLERWEERRGYTEEFRYPEDQARWFFDEHFKA